jgi:hypothetical protein
MLHLAATRLGVSGTDHFVEAGYPILLEAYGAGHRRPYTLYPGVVAAIERLRARGAATAICTNKPEALAIDLIDRLGLAALFDALVGADTLPVRKPDPAPYLAAVDRSGGHRWRRSAADRGHGHGSQDCRGGGGALRPRHVRPRWGGMWRIWRPRRFWTISTTSTRDRAVLLPVGDAARS